MTETYPGRFTERAKKVCELSLREALSLGHNYVGTEHLLLGLIREGEGLAAKVLVTLGLDADTVRNEIIRQLSSPREKPDKEAELVERIAARVVELLAAREAA